MAKSNVYFIRVNGTRIYFTVRENGGSLHLAYGCNSDQCDGCGSDIAETGYYDGRGDHADVVCSKCASYYNVSIDRDC